MNKSLKFMLLAVLLAVPAVLAAQDIKYVTYFPTPHVYFSNLTVTNAIVAASGEIIIGGSVYAGQGKVIVGSARNASDDFSNPRLEIGTAFAAQDMALWLTNTDASAGTDLIVGHMSAYPATTDYTNGTFSTLGNLTLTGTSVDSTTAQFTGLRAHNNITLKDIGWGANKNIVGSSSTTWPSTCSVNACLKWKQLKIKDTNVMRFYLVGYCSSSLC
jgi:hypothetical protein